MTLYRARKTNDPFLPALHKKPEWKVYRSLPLTIHSEHISSGYSTHRTLLRIFGQTNNRSAETPFVQKWLRHQQRAPMGRHHPPAYMKRFDVHTDTIKSLSNIKIQSRSSKQIVKFHRQKTLLQSFLFAWSRTVTTVNRLSRTVIN